MGGADSRQNEADISLNQYLRACWPSSSLLSGKTNCCRF
jgi:hypothetical protein